MSIRKLRDISRCLLGIYNQPHMFLELGTREFNQINGRGLGPWQRA
jgi:hypothetical protein